ncbi:hypothetical protein A9Q83_09690 [Alphaproteobacteria bacterium 46_93_T64]|nr:hypothetical protein A9Q83_09690 [Alphaproteobacteria bacterium 46_93_T64]
MRNDLNPVIKEKSVVSEFEEWVRLDKDAPVLSLDGEVWSYDELNNLANQLALRLVDVGATSGQNIGIDANCGRWFVVGVLAILKTGGAYIPLDPLFPTTRLRYCAEETSIDIVVCGSGSLLNTHLTVSHFVDFEEALDKTRLTGNLNIPVGPDDIAYVMYTSGTTSDPKGVEIRHRSILHLVQSATYVRLGPAERHLQLAPTGFDASTFEIWAPLLNGGTCVVYPGNTISLTELAGVLQSEKISVLWLTSSLFNMAIEQIPSALKNVTQLLTGGEELSVKHVQMALDLLPETALINGYGPTETTTFACSHAITSAGLESFSSVLIGKPINESYIRILDVDHNEVPVETTGELCVGGPGLARGYINDPALTAKKFIEYSDDGGGRTERLYRTGDLARRHKNGSIEFLGRIDDQIKIRGHRIEPGEIEAILTEKTAFINWAVVTFTARTGDLALGAILATGGTKPTIDLKRVRTVLEKYLPVYAIPSKILYIDTLPLTNNGKLDRATLSALLGDTDLQEQTARRSVTEETNERVANLWKKILRATDIDDNDNFFQLGGNSLQAIQMIAEVGESLHTRLPLSLIFAHPTLAEFCAALLRIERQSPLSPVINQAAIKTRQLSFGERQIWFEHHNSSRHIAYNIVISIEFSGRFQLSAMKTSLRQIVRKHEIFRTSYSQENEQILARTDKIDDVSVITTSLQEIQAPSFNELTSQLIMEEAAHVFSFTGETRPYRFRLIQCAEQHHVLLLNLHHILVDEWSIGILMQEFEAGYVRALSPVSAVGSTETIELYSDFCSWQQALVDGPEFEKQLGYWRRQLSGLSPVLALPTSEQRREETLSGYGRLDFTIPEQMSTALENYVSSKKTTLFALLLSVYAISLARFGQQNEVSIGIPVSIRDDKKLHMQVGYLLNTVVMRIQANKGMDFSDILEQVHESVLQALAHKDVPLELLVIHLAPERDDTGRPFFQTLFSLRQARVHGESIAECDIHIAYHNAPECKTDIALQFDQTSAGLKGVIEYSPARFGVSLIEDISEFFQSFLEKIVTCEAIPEAQSAASFVHIRPSEAEVEEYSGFTGDFEDNNDLKIALSRCWKKCLKIDSFSDSDSFFDLGGNSIRALLLVSEIEKTTGLHLNLPAIFEFKTFEAIYRNCVTEKMPLGDLIVSIRRGSEKPALICIHGLTYYQEIANITPPGIPIYGLLAKEHQLLISKLGAGLDWHVNLPELIDAYYQIVRDLQPTGPYQLLGHSFGGVVAFEVAKRLRNEGETVERLFLVDVLVAGSSYSYSYPYLKLLILWQHVRNREWRHLARSVQRISGKIYRSTPLASLFSSASSALSPGRILARQVTAKYQQVMGAYSPGRDLYDSPVILIRAHDTKTMSACAEDFGWQAAVKEPMEFIDLPGNHLSCLSQENIENLACYFENNMAKQHG